MNDTQFDPKPNNLDTLADDELQQLADHLRVDLSEKRPFSPTARQTIATKLAELKKINFRKRPPPPAYQFQDWSFLAELTQVEELDLSWTNIKDISPLNSLIHLNRLDLSFTAVQDLSALAQLQALDYLELNRLSITDLAPLAHLKKLRVLQLTNSSIRDLSPLTHLPNLKFLHLEGTGVTDLTPLMGIKSLDRLAVDGTDAQLDLLTEENFPTLKTLWILYDDYYPMLPEEQKKWNRINAQMPHCSLSRMPLY